MNVKMRSLLAATKRQLRPAIVIFLIFVLITGIAYPLLVTGIAQVSIPAPGERKSDVKMNGTVSVRRSSVSLSAIPQVFLGADYRPTPALSR